MIVIINLSKPASSNVSCCSQIRHQTSCWLYSRNILQNFVLSTGIWIPSRSWLHPSKSSLRPLWLRCKDKRKTCDSTSIRTSVILRTKTHVGVPIPNFVIRNVAFSLACPIGWRARFASAPLTRESAQCRHCSPRMWVRPVRWRRFRGV